MSIPLSKFARHYAGTLGLALVPIPLGLKGPREAGWNDPANTVTSREGAERVFGGASLNMGVLHSASGTATLDVDHAEWAALALSAVGLSLSELLAAPVRIRGKNGEKPFYRLPEGVQFDRHALAWPHPTEKKPGGQPVMVTVFELRAGAVQDVLPPSIHPDTGLPYQWAGNPPRTRQDIPDLPGELRELWSNWDAQVTVMKAACPWAAPEPAQKARQTPRPARKAQEGELRPGDAFRERVGLREVLERNGYQRRGERYLPPDSKTKVAGVRLLTGEDGVERAYSDHGSDPLNDGHAHDSFSACILLEHGGNVVSAVKACAAELGMVRPAPSESEKPAPPVLTEDEVRSAWSAAQSELVYRAGVLFDAMQGNPRQRAALFDLWLILTELACTSVIERNGRWYIHPGGMTNLQTHGATGARADISARLRYLAQLGFLRGVTQSDPADRYSALLLEVTPDPFDLPALNQTLEESKRWTVNVPTKRTRRAQKTLRKLPTINNALPKGSGELTLHFRSARQTVAYLAACPGLTVNELSALRGKHPEVIRRHVRALMAAGLVKRERCELTLTGTWQDYRLALRLDREGDTAWRTRMKSTLERTIRFCGATAFGQQGQPPRVLARRKRMLQTARERLHRLDLGEPVYEVMGLAA